MSSNVTFKQKVLSILKALKSETKIDVYPVIPIYAKRKLIGYLRVISKSSMEDKEEIRRLAVWRKKSQSWFPSQFVVTHHGTKRWLEKNLLNQKDRILFFIETPTGIPVGHVGLFRFNFDEISAEIDNVIRGEKHIPGVMTHAILTLVNWARKVLGVKKFYLQVFSDNDKAISLYRRCGFKEVKKVPLKKMVKDNERRWVEVSGVEERNYRYNIYMLFG